jgi:hypothetical protein
MPLPNLNTLIATAPNLSTLGAALNNHPPVTAGNDHFGAKTGNLSWAGHTMTVSAVGVGNYWFIPDKLDAASYCTIPCGGGGTAYVISTQYGGCEYHELYHAGLNMLAFLHVYRGDGATTQYVAAAGWVVRSVKRSATLSQAHGMRGSNWSFSEINLATTAVQSKFIHVEGYPNMTVTGEDNGDAAYPIVVPVLAVAARPSVMRRIGNLLRLK